jgi:polyhydroxybutyrate depolymerase
MAPNRVDVLARRALPKLALVLAACGSGTGATASAQDLGPGDHEIRLRHGGRTRLALVHVPPAASRASSLPLVLAFHGGGGEASSFKAEAGLDAVADREGFIVAYPFGTGPFQRRLLTWNAGMGCCGYAREHQIDDVGFAIALIDELSRRTRIGERRVYVTGHSNGAMMTYRIAAERADRIAAIAPVGGAMDVESFAPAHPVPVLHVHSVDDPRALYDGGLGPPFPGTNHRVMHRPVEDGLARWREHNGCMGAPTISKTRRGESGSMNEGQSAKLLVWSPCAQGSVVEHWQLTAVGHGWPGRESVGAHEEIIGPPTTLVDAAEEVWAFVSRFRR